MKDIDINF
jgi:metal-dependent amidase/aminoacylase/carboxypeptidase family protein